MTELHHLPSLYKSTRLENKSRPDYDYTRVAAEHCSRIKKVRRKRSDLIQGCQASRADWIHRINRTRHVLRVVESVEEVSTNLKVLRLADTELLKNGDIEVIDRRQQKGVASYIGKSAITSLNVPGIRVIGHVADCT